MVAIPILAGNESVIRPVPDDLVEELQRVQKIAQTITSILDLDQVIDSIVNDVATWFGCVEASVFLHDEERHEMVMASVRGCTLHAKGHRLKIGEEGLVGTRHLPPQAGCTTRPMFARTSTTLVAKTTRFRRLEFLSAWATGWSGLHGVASGTGCVSAAEAENSSGALRSRCDCDSQRAAVSTGTVGARGPGPRRQEARVIQQALLPKSSPYIPGFAISGLSVPARAVGGDWYDFISFPDGRWGIFSRMYRAKGRRRRC